MTRRIVDEAIRTSRMRMGVESLDLLQFHWWEYDDASYLDALKHLAGLQHGARCSRNRATCRS
jgi:aryl-alcohol dehydrogenase-like predicted oxidoreductase